MKFYYCVLLLLIWTDYIHGAAYRADVDTERVYGKTVKFCTYKKLRLLPKSVIRDYDDCVKCECTGKGLFCVTLVNMYNIPDDSRCQMVSIGCKSRWVMKRDNNRRCRRRLFPLETEDIN